MRRAVLFFFVAVLAEKWPTEGPNGKTCDEHEYPEVLSYHIHVRWDQDNATQGVQALAAKKVFMQDFGIKTDWCPMSHADPGVGYEGICYFPFDDNPPYSYSHLFGGANYAFHVPIVKYMEVMNWWRERHSEYGLDYAMHQNSGCGRKDHSIFSMTNLGYPVFDQSTDGLWCCKDKPPGCLCTLVQYVDAKNTSNCLTQVGSGIALKPCTSQTMGSWGQDVWRETVYTQDTENTWVFSQMENYGTLPGGENDCMTLEDENHPPFGLWCNRNYTRVTMMSPCDNDQLLNRVEWVQEHGIIRHQTCSSCLKVDEKGAIWAPGPTLDDCLAEATRFERRWID